LCRALERLDRGEVMEPTIVLKKLHLLLAHALKIALAALLLIATAPGCSGGGSGSGGGNAAPACAADANVAWDSNGDGDADSICVSDFDGDGILELDDLQDAIDSLAGAAPRTVTVLPGDYGPPPDPTTRPGRGRGLVEIGDDTTLRCEPGAILRAAEGTEARNNFAVVANENHELGNRNLVITGCEIDGGAPDGYVHSPYVVGARMGLYLRRTRNSLVEGNHVHHTYHTGLYTSNSTGDVFRDNRIEDAGGYGNEDEWDRRIRYPCIYAFSFAGEPVLDFVAEDNEMRRCASSGLNTRADTSNGPGDVIRNMRWTGNRIRDTGNSTGDGVNAPPDGSSCMYIRGVDTAIITDNECHSTGPIFLYNAASGYRSQGDDDANANLILERLVVIDADSTAGLWVGRFVDGLIVRDVEVLGTRMDDGSAADLNCMTLQPPYRRALFERIRLTDCGRTGLKEAVSVGSGGTPEEEIVIRGLEIEGTDLFDPLDLARRPGIWFQAPQRGLMIESVTIREVTGSGLLFQRGVEESVLRDIEIDGVEPGWLGYLDEADAPACDASKEGNWITTADGTSSADCDFAPGSTGSTPARCGCTGGNWMPLVSLPRAGIELRAATVPVRNVTLEDVRVSNVRDDTGIRILGEVSDVRVRRLLGSDTSQATDADQNSAIELPSPLSDVGLEDVLCVGTDPDVPCIEFASP